ncbi:MAG: hypothetical protein LC102_10015 [Ignavibacteriales bacterium]|nr:hypothetical protein [Ignavibacteriales bacterium]
MAKSKKKEQTPKPEGQTPKAEEQTPKAEEQTPKAEEQTPKPEEQTPKAEEQTPKAEEQTPKPEEQTPKAEEQTPKAPERKRKITQNVLKYSRGTLYVLLSIIVALLVFSQTSFFRSILKDELTSILNETLRGKVSIGSIEGTLVTNLMVNEIKLTDSANVEILSIRRIEVYPRLLDFFRNKINVEKLHIDGLKADLVTDSNGVLNIVKILPPPTEEEEVDTVPKPFPYLIKAGSFEMTDSKLNFRNWDKTDPTAEYVSMNMEDLRLRSIDIKLENIEIGIANNAYSLDFSRFNIAPNFKNTAKLSIQGAVAIAGRKIDLNELKIETAGSNLEIDYHTEELNLFDNFTLDSLENANFNLKFDAAPFHFADLTTVVEGFDLLRGPVEMNLAAEGDFHAIKLTQLDLKAHSTLLKLKGSVIDPLNADKMRISASITNSVLNPPDIHEIMPSLNLRQFLVFPQVSIDTLGFYGTPLTFKGGLGMRSSAGNIAGSYSFDFAKNQPFYEVDLKTEKLDISKYIQTPLNLTSKIRARGHGFDPSNAEFEIDLAADHSVADKFFFDELALKTKGKAGKILLDFSTRMSGQTGNISGELDLSNMKRPVYSIKSAFTHLKPEVFVGNSLENSLLSFTMEANGEGFDPNDMVLRAQVDMQQAIFKGDDLGDLSADIRITAEPGMQKDIFITSNLFTASTSGRFDYASIGSNIGNEMDKLLKDVAKIMHNYYPDFFDNSDTVSAAEVQVAKTAAIQKTAGVSDSLAFSFQVNDLGPIRKFLKFKTFDVQGALSGSVIIDTNKFEFKLKHDLDLFKFKAADTSSTIILWNAVAKIEIEHPTDKVTIADLNGLIDTKVKKIFLLNKGKTDTLSNTQLVVSLSNSILDMEKIAVDYNSMMKAKLAFVVDFMKDSLELNMYDAKLEYDGYNLENTRNTILAFSKNFLFVKDFGLGQGDNEYLALNAKVSTSEFNADLRVQNLTISQIMRDFVKQPLTQPVDANIELAINAGGSFDNPVIDANFRVDNLRYRKETMGRLVFNAKYENEEVRPNGFFYSGETNAADSMLSVTGVIPYKISLSDGIFDFVKDKKTDLRIDAKSFSLNALNGFIPNIQELQGVFESGISISGYYPHLVRKGTAEVKGGLFRVSMTKLLYGLQLGVELKDSTLEVTKLLLTNEGERVEAYGKLSGTGKFMLNGFEPVSGQVNLGGTLTVMDSPSPSKELPIFGKLVVSTNEDIVFKIDRNNYFVKASVNLDKTDLTIPPTGSGVAGAGDNYIYKYKNYDTIKVTSDTLFAALFDDEIFEPDTTVKQKKELPFNLEYQFKVTMSKGTKMTMIFSQEANQKLTTFLQGELNYEKLKGFENVQGELTVSDESTLEFLNLKTFAASGKLRFEREIFNPYLDIEANYNSYYVFAGKGTSNEQPVQVKLKLKGSMDELSTKFAKESDNIAVYVGEDNIKNSVASPQYDKADAVWFILTGKFKSDLTEADKSSAEGQISTIQGTATSLAGSLLGGLLSSYLGDYVKSLEVRAAGNQTKFNLSGQVSNIKYSFGGSTNVFRDISSATFKFEIPVLKDFLLRIERRESTTDGSTTNSMINEMGLKYKIEF